MGRKRPRGKKGNSSSLINKGADKLSNSLTDALSDYWDGPEEMLEEAEENKFGPLEPVLDLGEDWELVATPGGPVDPWDCERWPGSIYCDGGFEPGDWASFGLGDIKIDGCGIIISMQWSVLGFEMPIVSFGMQSTDPNCQPEEGEEEVQTPGVDPTPGEGEPPIPFPSWNPNFLYALTFQSYHPSAPTSLQYRYDTYFAWGPINIEAELSEYPNRPGIFYPNYYLYAAGVSVIDNRTGVPRPNNRGFAGDAEGWDSQMFPSVYEDLKGDIIISPPAWGLSLSSQKIKRIKLKRFLDGEPYPAMFGSPFPEVPVLVKARIIGCYGKFNHSYTARIKGIIEQQAAANGYVYNQDAWGKAWGKMIPQPEDVDPELQRWFNVPLYECGLGDKAPDDYHDGWGKIRGNMNDCCNLSQINTRLLRQIHAVLQPNKFVEFDESSGKPKEIVGKIPKRLTTPGGEGYEKIAGYSDSLAALIRMLDRISGFWPATVEIEDIDPNTEGNQSFSLQVHSISDGFKQALEALAQIIIKSNSTPQQQDDEDDPTLKILAAILTEVGLTHKIAAITQHTTNNIEEFLDYKVRQQEEFLPMAFNPLVERTWQELEYTKPTKAQMDQYIDKLLTPSIQDIIVTKIEDNKLLTEWMLELLKHSSAASAALTQQIKSKEDLKKAMGTARFNALVQGALNMEQIRRVLGLPSNWDMSDFSERLEDNFHPDENVESGLHAETKPKQAKEKPRIKDISKNGRRRKR